jgi:hypothetical protein
MHRFCTCTRVKADEGERKRQQWNEYDKRDIIIYDMSGVIKASEREIHQWAAECMERDAIT